jgi:hypothetical protein
MRYSRIPIQKVDTYGITGIFLVIKIGRFCGMGLATFLLYVYLPPQLLRIVRIKMEIIK